MKKFLLILSLTTAACQYPATTVSTVDAHPMLRILGASPTAMLSIDNQPAGPARSFGEGNEALIVAHGTHLVEVRDGSAILYKSDVYFGDGTTKTISLTPGVQ